MKRSLSALLMVALAGSFPPGRAAAQAPDQPTLPCSPVPIQSCPVPACPAPLPPVCPPADCPTPPPPSCPAVSTSPAGEPCPTTEAAKPCAEAGEPSTPNAPTGPAAAPAKPDDPDCEFWGEADYLLWWVKRGPLVPLVTTNGNPATIASLANPGTRVLLGGPAGGVDYDALNGVRFTVGAGKDGFGVEGTFFFLERESFHFAAATPGGQTAPIVAVPIFATVPFNFNPAGESSFNGGGAPFGVRVDGSITFWGAEANGRFDVIRTPNWRATLLGGFRFLELEETLALTAFSPDGITGGGIGLRDAWESHNNFLGAQVGFRSGVTWEMLSFDMVGKVAFGNVQQSYTATGTTTVTAGAFGRPTGVSPAGILVLPSNAGKYDRGAFAYVPEGQVNLGCRFTDHFSASVGYSILYVSDVVRASGQVTRAINPTQHPVFGGGLAGTPAPLPAFQSTDFWSQGLTFGLQFAF